jgi:hypothetical protein
LTADTIRLACAWAAGDDFVALEENIDALEAMSSERYSRYLVAQEELRLGS